MPGTPEFERLLGSEGSAGTWQPLKKILPFSHVWETKGLCRVLFLCVGNRALSSKPSTHVIANAGLARCAFLVRGWRGVICAGREPKMDRMGWDGEERWPPGPGTERKRTRVSESFSCFRIQFARGKGSVQGKSGCRVVRKYRRVQGTDCRAQGAGTGTRAPKATLMVFWAGRGLAGAAFLGLLCGS